jgi:hypothetical protein
MVHLIITNASTKEQHKRVELNNSPLFGFAAARETFRVSLDVNPSVTLQPVAMATVSLFMLQVVPVHLASYAASL